MKTILGRISPFCEGGEERVVCDYLLSSLKKNETHLSLVTSRGSGDGGIMEDTLFFLKGKLSSQQVPNNLVADIHSCIGLIQDHMGHPQQAIRSLMNALWIQQKMMTTLTTASLSLSQVQQPVVIKKKIDYDEVVVSIALTEHRLGVLYGQVGDYENAVSLLQKAFNAYGQSKMKSDHTVYLQAEESLTTFRTKVVLESEKEKLLLRSSQSLRGSGRASRKSLSGIVEEGGSPRRSQSSSSTTNPPNEVFLRSRAA